MKKIVKQIVMGAALLMSACSSPLNLTPSESTSSVPFSRAGLILQEDWGVITASGGRVLDVQNGAVGNGSLIHIWDNVKQESALWKWEPSGLDGYFKIRNKKSGRILDVQYGQVSNGARLHLWDDLGQTSGQWKVVSVLGKFQIVNRNSSLMMDLRYGEMGNGTAVHQWANVGQNSALFDLGAFIPQTKWSLRGTFNNWQTQPMTEVKSGVFEARVDFGPEGGELKVDKYGDWSESYPDKNLRVTEGSWIARFRVNEKSLTLRRLNSPNTFNFNEAVFYMVIPDRFVNGDPSNDHSYGRGLQANGTEETEYKKRDASFHGGDYKGLTQKIKEGYFNDLGVNGLWISPPFEQPHGWYPDNGGEGEGYAGYWALDFTTIDRNLGTEEEFATLITEAHKKGLRVIVDVVFNHAGAFTIKDAAELGFGKLKDGWETYEQKPTLPVTEAQFFSQFDLSPNATSQWAQWWGDSWTRLTLNPREPIRQWFSLPGYDPYDTNPLFEIPTWVLPDFNTGSPEDVEIPLFLQKKWGLEKTQIQNDEMDAFESLYGKGRTVRNWVVKWLTDWVEKYGVDGFRCDTVDFVELSNWKFLLETARTRLKKWKESHPTEKIDDSPFWATGEPCREGRPLFEYYQNAGMDSMLNFGISGTEPRRYFVDSQNFQAIDSFWAANADQLDQLPMTHISNHDLNTFRNPVNKSEAPVVLDQVNADRQKRGALMLLLNPRAVNLYYGDEVARDIGPKDFNDLRWDFPWSHLDSNRLSVLDFWKTVGKFRERHPAVSSGAHQTFPGLSFYGFSRISYSDRVFVGLGVKTPGDVPVMGVFPDGSWVREALTGQRAQVISGRVSFSNLILDAALVEAALP